MALAGITKLTRQGQLTLPVDVRRDFGIEIGDKLMVYTEEEGILIVPESLRAELNEEQMIRAQDEEAKLKKINEGLRNEGVEFI